MTFTLYLKPIFLILILTFKMIKMRRLRTTLRWWGQLVRSNMLEELYKISCSLTFLKIAFKTLRFLSLIGQFTDNLFRTYWSNKAINSNETKSSCLSSFPRCTATSCSQQSTRKFYTLGSSNTISWCTSLDNSGRTTKSSKLSFSSRRRWYHPGVLPSLFRKMKVNTPLV
jgi:hypothetical protein